MNATVQPTNGNSLEAPNEIQYADGVLFNNIEFSIGQNVALNGTSFDERAKILKIWRNSEADSPKLEVQFYYHILNLPFILGDLPAFISERELFLSDRIEQI